jgi:hypothetical protein
LYDVEYWIGSYAIARADMVLKSLQELYLTWKKILAFADTLSAMLKTHWDKPRVYIGCMKSGEVFSES